MIIPDSHGKTIELYFVERVEFWPRTEGLSIVPKQNLCGRRRVHDDDWNVAKLDLVDGTIRFRP